ncbi:MAG: hypothetical protein HPZ91_09065 [Lentisphaeria bacterium]|nr:hypothetical protein [Lentisphaeria bacterium]
MNTENKNIVNLNDDDLDSVTGGVFNQNFIKQHDLKALADRSGGQAVIIRAATFTGSAGGFSYRGSEGPCSEKRFRSLCDNPALKSLELQDNKGQWVSFSKSQLQDLLKG